MRSRALLIVLLVAVGAAGCGGGDDDAEPLTLQQRLPAAADTRGYEPDPVELGGQTSNLTAVASDLPLVQATHQKAEDVFEKAGFVSGISEVLFRPANPGGAHSGERPHLAFFVAELDSEDGANEVVDFLIEDARQPCPGSCADQVSEFEVDSIPDARTVRRFATKERIEALGREGDRPRDSYLVGFVDGDFAYMVESFGPPGSVTEAQLERVAKSLYERVQGAPAK